MAHLTEDQSLAVLFKYFEAGEHLEMCSAFHTKCHQAFLNLGWGYSSVVEFLLSMCKTLNSTSSTKGKKQLKTRPSKNSKKY